MQNRKLLVGLACLTASSTLYVDTAHADRRTGLGGNLLIQDADDVFPFPQYAVKHRNMIRLDYGATEKDGNGLLTLGDENSAYGIALHRGDLLNPDIVGFNTELAYLSGVSDPFGRLGASFPGPQWNALPTPNTGADQPIPNQTPVPNAAANSPVLPATVVDLMYGRRLGDNAVGMRVGFGRGIRSYNDDGDVQKGQQTFVVVQGGYSLAPAQGLKLDLAANVMFAHGSATDAAGDTINKGNAIRAGFLGRGYYPINDIVDIGFLGQASFSNQRNKVDAIDDKQNDFLFGFMAGVGPSIKLDRAKVAAYAGLLGNVNKSDPSTETDDDHTKPLRFMVPMVNMAAEVQLLDWLYVRTGTQYSWDLDRQKADVVKTRASAGNFIWTAGLGMVKDSFNFDMVVKNSFITNGPDFIGGAGGGFLAMASLTYRFGDVFSGSSSSAPVQETAPVEPAPAPAPAYEPPPPPPAPVAPAPEASTEGSVESGSGSIGGSVGGSIGTN